MIVFSEVHKRYPGGHEALRGVNLRVEAGEMVYLTGPSGAGKSTLLKLIAAIERPTSGALMVNHQNVGSLRPRAIPFLRRRLGLILPEIPLLYDRNVLANVLLPLQIAGYAPQEAQRRARAALDKVGLLGRDRAMPMTLSGGEQQRVAIARAVVARPSILLADEPTANLDSAQADAILEIFRSFNQVGVTLLLATHDLHLIERFPARRLLLDGGRLRS
ncbi:MAG: ATP-binding cassette domain-containing protein [Burkholderiales bacterium]|nr:MAG: ATP-binding cassette domain-containing protein [Burkholderiales bacterium]